jgi:hypothetical protein
LLYCTVRVFRQKFTLEDAIGSHACSLEANMRVTNGIPLGCSLLLPVAPVNCVQTLKDSTAFAVPTPVKIAIEVTQQPEPNAIQTDTQSMKVRCSSLPSTLPLQLAGDVVTAINNDEVVVLLLEQECTRWYKKDVIGSHTFFRVHFLTCYYHEFHLNNEGQSDGCD